MWVKKKPQGFFPGLRWIIAWSLASSRPGTKQAHQQLSKPCNAVHVAEVSTKKANRSRRWKLEQQQQQGRKLKLKLKLKAARGGPDKVQCSAVQSSPLRTSRCPPGFFRNNLMRPRALRDRIIKAPPKSRFETTTPSKFPLTRIPSCATSATGARRGRGWISHSRLGGGCGRLGNGCSSYYRDSLSVLSTIGLLWRQRVVEQKVSLSLRPEPIKHISAVAACRLAGPHKSETLDRMT